MSDLGDTARSPQQPLATGTIRPWTEHLPRGMDADGVDVLAEESLPRAWMARWGNDPGRTVFETPEGQRLSAGELEERSRLAAARFAGAGVDAGDRIVLSAGASLDLVVAYVAAHRMGLVVVPMNTAYSPREIRDVLLGTAPSMAVVDDAERGRLVSAASAAPLTVVGTELALPHGAEPALDQSTRSTPALICHTSGTTGRPKGAVLTSGNLLASAEAVRIAWRWSPDDRLALALPMFHLHGLGVGLNGTLVAGACALLLGSFDPTALKSAIEDRGATMFFGVPTMYHRLTPPMFTAALRRLRLCVSGSAPLPATLHESFEESTGQRILERYGMTETVMNLSNPHDGERRAGTVGFPLPGVSVRLSGAAGDAPSEIEIKGPNVFRGYWDQPEATADAFTSDGWLRSGDLGVVDDMGYVRVVGRSKELIISGGYNVYPAEVENVLRTYPGVVDVAVVGDHSEEWGEQVTAVVVADGALASDDLIAFAAAQLAPYKRPRSIRFESEIPRNDLGKIQRDKLVR